MAKEDKEKKQKGISPKSTPSGGSRRQPGVSGRQRAENNKVRRNQQRADKNAAAKQKTAGQKATREGSNDKFFNDARQRQGRGRLDKATNNSVDPDLNFLINHSSGVRRGMDGTPIDPNAPTGLDYLEQNGPNRQSVQDRQADLDGRLANQSAAIDAAFNQSAAEKGFVRGPDGMLTPGPDHASNQGPSVVPASAQGGRVALDAQGNIVGHSFVPGTPSEQQAQETGGLTPFNQGQPTQQAPAQQEAFVPTAPNQPAQQQPGGLGDALTQAPGQPQQPQNPIPQNQPQAPSPEVMQQVLGQVAGGTPFDGEPQIDSMLGGVLPESSPLDFDQLSQAPKILPGGVPAPDPVAGQRSIPTLPDGRLDTGGRGVSPTGTNFTIRQELIERGLSPEQAEIVLSSNDQLRNSIGAEDPIGIFFKNIFAPLPDGHKRTVAQQHANSDALRDDFRRVFTDTQQRF